MLPLIPAELKLAVKPLLASIAALTEQIRQADEHVAALAEEKYPETKVLRQVKGIGPLIALTYVLTLEDPYRFAKSRTVGSYLGLGPRQKESGDSAPQLGITKAGNNHLRWLLIQGSNDIVGPLAPGSDGDCSWPHGAERMASVGPWWRWHVSWLSCCVVCGSLRKCTNRCAGLNPKLPNETDVGIQEETLS